MVLGSCKFELLVDLFVEDLSLHMPLAFTAMQVRHAEQHAI